LVSSAKYRLLHLQRISSKISFYGRIFFADRRKQRPSQQLFAEGPPFFGNRCLF
jgi:hypothetical protein